eukprot:gene17-854_t
MSALVRRAVRPLVKGNVRCFANITDNVHFDTIAREWRCKWPPDNNMASLTAAQEVLNKHIAKIKSIEGVKDVKRVVCGGCMDFKIIASLPADKWGAFEEAGH